MYIFKLFQELEALQGGLKGHAYNFFINKIRFLQNIEKCWPQNPWFLSGSRFHKCKSGPRKTSFSYCLIMLNNKASNQEWLKVDDMTKRETIGPCSVNY